MKRTIIPFSVTLILSISMLLAVGLSGCDWFNTNVLGKPNQAEIDAKEIARQKEMDSLRHAEMERLNNLDKKVKEQETNSTSTTDRKYKIVVGSFEEQENVDKTIETFKAHGFKPITFKMGTLTCVVIISFDSLLEAETALENYLESDYFPEDSWVYHS